MAKEPRPWVVWLLLAVGVVLMLWLAESMPEFRPGL